MEIHENKLFQTTRWMIRQQAASREVQRIGKVAEGRSGAVAVSNPGKGRGTMDDQCRWFGL